MQWSIRDAYIEIEQRLEPRWMRPLMTTIHFIVAVVHQAIRDNLSIRAAMLSYWTLVAVVPLLLLAFALIGASGYADNAIRETLYSLLLADSIDADVGHEIDKFLSNTSLSTIGVLGVLGIIAIGAQLYFQVEQAYNDIFYTKPKRSLFSRFVGFYATVTLAPLLIAAGFVLTSTLTNTLGVEDIDVPFLRYLLAFFAPIAVTSIAMVGMIRYLPSANVSWTAALSGGITGALLFEAAKRGFSVYLILLGTENSMARLYGSVGLFPVFLIWLNILWTIVLLGVEIAYVVQHWTRLVQQQHRWVVDPHSERRVPDAFFALAVMSVITVHFLQARGPTSVNRIARALSAPDRHVQATLELLEVTRLISETEDGHFLPAVPLHDTPISEVVHRWREITGLDNADAHFPSKDTQHAALESLDALFDKPLSSLMTPENLEALQPLLEEPHKEEAVSRS